MVQEWLTKGVFLYLMAGICGVGILLKIILAGYFDRQVRLTRKMDGVKKKWLLGMRQDYEDCVDVHGRMNNVDIFVDKYIEGKKFMGIMLSTWDKIGGQAWILCAGLLVVAAVSGVFYQVDREAILFTFFIGTWTVIVDIVVDNIANLTEKKNQLKRNLKDYFENRALCSGNETLREQKAQEEDAPEALEDNRAFGEDAAFGEEFYFAEGGSCQSGNHLEANDGLEANEGFEEDDAFEEDSTYKRGIRSKTKGNGKNSMFSEETVLDGAGDKSSAEAGETGPKFYVVSGKEKNAVGAPAEDAEKKTRRESKKELAARKKREHIKRELKQEMTEKAPQEEMNPQVQAAEEPVKKAPSREAMEQLAAALERLKKENSLEEAGPLLAAQIGREQENGALIEEVLREFLI